MPDPLIKPLPFDPRIFASDRPLDIGAAPNRGLLGDVGSAFARGLVTGVGFIGDLGETFGIKNSIDDWAQDATLKYEALRPDVDTLTGKDSLFKQFSLNAIESIGMMAPAILGNIALGSVNPALGMYGGSLIGGLLFGAGEAQRQMREYEAAGGTDEERKRELGRKAFATEAGLEALGEAILFRTPVIFRSVFNPKTSVVRTVKDLLRPMTAGRVVKTIGKTMLGETLTEIGQNVASQYYGKEYGVIDDPRYAETVLETIPPTLMVSFLFGAAQSKLGRSKYNQYKKVLTNPEKFSEKVRQRVVDEVTQALSGLPIEDEQGNLYRPDDSTYNKIADAFKNIAEQKVVKDAEGLNIDDNIAVIGGLKSVLDQKRVVEDYTKKTAEATQKFLDDLYPGLTMPENFIADTLSFKPEDYSIEAVEQTYQFRPGGEKLEAIRQKVEKLFPDHDIETDVETAVRLAEQAAKRVVTSNENIFNDEDVDKAYRLYVSRPIPPVAQIKTAIDEGDIQTAQKYLDQYNQELQQHQRIFETEQIAKDDLKTRQKGYINLIDTIAERYKEAGALSDQELSILNQAKKKLIDTTSAIKLLDKGVVDVELPSEEFDYRTAHQKIMDMLPKFDEQIDAFAKELGNPEYAGLAKQLLKDTIEQYMYNPQAVELTLEGRKRKGTAGTAAIKTQPESIEAEMLAYERKPSSEVVAEQKAQAVLPPTDLGVTEPIPEISPEEEASLRQFILQGTEFGYSPEQAAEVMEQRRRSGTAGTMIAWLPDSVEAEMFNYARKRPAVTKALRKVREAKATLTKEERKSLKEFIQEAKRIMQEMLGYSEKAADEIMRIRMRRGTTGTPSWIEDIESEIFGGKPKLAHTKVKASEKVRKKQSNEKPETIEDVVTSGWSITKVRRALNKILGKNRKVKNKDIIEILESDRSIKGKVVKIKELWDDKKRRQKKFVKELRKKLIKNGYVIVPNKPLHIPYNLISRLLRKYKLSDTDLSLPEELGGIKDLYSNYNIRKLGGGDVVTVTFKDESTKVQDHAKTEELRNKEKGNYKDGDHVIVVYSKGMGEQRFLDTGIIQAVSGSFIVVKLDSNGAIISFDEKNISRIDDYDFIEKHIKNGYKIIGKDVLNFGDIFEIVSKIKKQGYVPSEEELKKHPELQKAMEDKFNESVAKLNKKYPGNDFEGEITGRFFVVTPSSGKWVGVTFSGKNLSFKALDEGFKKARKRFKGGSEEMAARLAAKMKKETAPAKQTKETIVGKTPKIVYGKEDTAYTHKNVAVPVKWAVVELDDLIVSHDRDTMLENADYPQELQPRDRSRAGYAKQIVEIANKLNPERLSRSPETSTGAPIVGKDLIVESGNGRTMAIGLAYDQGKAKAYKEYLKKIAPDLGIKREAIDKMNKPVLVRVRTNEMTMQERADFAKEAGVSGVQATSPTEQAISDAEKLKTISDFVVSEDGNINTTANKPFIERFINTVVPEAERGSVVDSEGRLSRQGVSRIKNAVFQFAYNAPDLVELASESTDNNIRNIINGMMQAAPKIAKVKELIADGKLYDVDISPLIVDAARNYLDLKSRDISVDEFLKQQGLFGEDIPAEVKELIKILDEAKRSGKQIFDFLSTYADNVMRLARKDQKGLFGDNEEVKDVISFIKGVADETIKARIKKRSGQADLFVERKKGSEGTAKYQGQINRIEDIFDADSIKEINTFLRSIGIDPKKASGFEKWYAFRTNNIELSEEAQRKLGDFMQSMVDINNHGLDFEHIERTYGFEIVLNQIERGEEPNLELIADATILDAVKDTPKAKTIFEDTVNLPLDQVIPGVATESQSHIQSEIDILQKRLEAEEQRLSEYKRIKAPLSEINVVQDKINKLNDRIDFLYNQRIGDAVKKIDISLDEVMTASEPVTEDPAERAYVVQILNKEYQKLVKSIYDRFGNLKKSVPSKDIIETFEQMSLIRNVITKYGGKARMPNFDLSVSPVAFANQRARWLTVSDVEAQVEELLGKPTDLIKVVQSPSDVGAPANVSGVYYSGEGQIYIIADNVRDVRTTLIHEALHFLIDKDTKYKKVYDNFLEKFKKLDTEKAKNAYQRAKINNPGADENTLLEEAFAYYLQDIDPQNQSWWNRLKGAVKAWLNRMGFKIQLTDDEILAVITGRLPKVIEQVEQAKQHASSMLEGAVKYAHDDRFTHKTYSPYAEEAKASADGVFTGLRDYLKNEFKEPAKSVHDFAVFVRQFFEDRGIKAVSDNDAKLLDRLQLPFYLAKKYNSIAKAYEAFDNFFALERAFMHKFTYIFEGKTIKLWDHMPESERNAYNEFVIEADVKWSELEEYDKEHGISPYQLGPKAQELLNKIAKKHGVKNTDRIRVLYEHWLEANRTALNTYAKKLAEKYGAKNDAVAKILAQMGRIKYYFPRERKGNTEITVYDKDGVKVFSRFVDSKLPANQRHRSPAVIEVIDNEVSQNYKESDGFRVEIKARKKQTAFQSIRPKDRLILEKLIEDMVDGMDNVDEKTKESYKERLENDLADFFRRKLGLEKGFQRSKRHIPGYEIKNVRLIQSKSLIGLAKQIAKLEMWADLQDAYRLVPEENLNELSLLNDYVSGQVRRLNQLDRVINEINGMAFIGYIAGNIGSPLVNTTSLPINSLWTLVADYGDMNYSSVGRISKQLLTATKDALKIIKRVGVAGFHKSYDLANPEDIAKMSEELKIPEQELKALGWFLDTKTGSHDMVTEILQKYGGLGSQFGKDIARITGYFFSATEKLVRVSTFLAAYRLETARSGKVLKESSIRKIAKQAVGRTQGIYSTHNYPMWLQGDSQLKSLLRGAYIFQHFQYTTVMLWREMMGRGWRTGFKFLGGVFATTGAIGGLFAVPGVSIFLTLMGKMTGDDYKEKFEEKLSSLLTHGLPATLGVDISARLALNIPVLNEYAKPQDSFFGFMLKELFPIPATVIDDTYKTITEATKVGLVERDPEKAIGLIFRYSGKYFVTPLPRNIITAYQLYHDGLTSQSGMKYMVDGKRYYLNAMEALVKAGGIQPLSLSKVYTKRQSHWKRKAYWDTRLRGIYRKIRIRGGVDGEILKDINDYNHDLAARVNDLQFIRHRRITQRKIKSVLSNSQKEI